MAKKKQEQFNNRDMVIIILVVVIIMPIIIPFMYYIGSPWISDINDKVEAKENIIESCFIEYAKEYCENNSMIFDRETHDWGQFYCLDRQELRKTGRNTKFYFTSEELKHCNYDVFEVEDES